VAAAVVEAVGGGAAGAGGLVLGEGLWLPRRAPRVLAVALDDPRGELGRLQARVARRLTDGGWFRAEARPYLPHVTVARVRSRGNERDLRALVRAPLAPPPALGFDGSSVALLRSHLGSGGARYEALARAELR
jgi:2'-5' RNA ligase